MWNREYIMRKILQSRYNVFRRYSSFSKKRNPKNKGGGSMDHLVIPDEMKPTYQEILDVLDKNLSEVLAERDGIKTVRKVKRDDIISYQRILDVFDKNIKVARLGSK